MTGRRRPGRRTGLDRADVVAAALDLVVRDGPGRAHHAARWPPSSTWARPPSTGTSAAATSSWPPSSGPSPSASPSGRSPARPRAGARRLPADRRPARRRARAPRIDPEADLASDAPSLLDELAQDVTIARTPTVSGLDEGTAQRGVASPTRSSASPARTRRSRQRSSSSDSRPSSSSSIRKRLPVAVDERERRLRDERRRPRIGRPGPVLPLDEREGATREVGKCVRERPVDHVTAHLAAVRLDSGALPSGHLALDELATQASSSTAHALLDPTLPRRARGRCRVCRCRGGARRPRAGTGGRRRHRPLRAARSRGAGAEGS